MTKIQPSARRGTAVVTGAGSGIGLALTMLLAQKGWRVIAGIWPESQMTSMQGIANVHPVLLDVTSDSSVKAAVEFTSKLVKGDGIQALFNNAGIACTGAVECVPVKDFQAVLDVNVTGVYRVTQEFLPLLRHQTPSTIVITGSAAGTLATPLSSAYTCSKFAMEGFADCLRYELADQGIRVVMVKPGGVRTSIWSSSAKWSDSIRDGVPAETLARYSRLHKQARSFMYKLEHVDGIPADHVAQLMVKAVEAQRPRSRYFTHLELIVQQFLRRLLPDWIWDRILKSELEKAEKRYKVTDASFMN